MPFVAFDLQSTLCTFEHVVKQLHVLLTTKTHLKLETCISRKFFYYWYDCSLRDYIATSQAGKYCPLQKVLKAVLPRAMICFFDDETLLLTKDDIESILKTFEQPYLDSEALQALDRLLEEREKGLEHRWEIWILSIGGFGDTMHFLSKAGISKYADDNILCCDDMRVSKPHPKVYSEMMRLAVHKTKRIENFYMIGSYAFELASAKNVSLRTVFLNSKEKIYTSQMYDTGEPDIVGHSLVDCVEKMIEFEKKRKHLY
ncbi:uncharacterized protein B0P05DRAFT_557164 [Gilbertella persicaria]|uniref:uncharacterized protein n=1 Tax=Gilbertella persicaria TaxID=101096 RepID=UPI00221FCDF3|nr:uncharacterized protein B0P05DRAFT_557164 [Gilbertella persicaria]KAI8061477.1 hypothetical protein B0P05DRAFT_557164 [Gilbertella persicaria]